MFQKILAEIMQKIDRYIPRDNDMRSPTAVLINELVHKYKKDKEMQNARMAVDSFFLCSRMGAYLNGQSELLELNGFSTFSIYVLRCIITKRLTPVRLCIIIRNLLQILRLTQSIPKYIVWVCRSRSWQRGQKQTQLRR